MIHKIGLHVLSTIFLLSSLHQVNAQWSLDQISGTDGLSQNTIKSIIQDRNGFIWIGTYYGINKFDGYSMKHFKFSAKENSLSSNLTHKLFEDKDGYIWAATSDAGINRIEPSTGKIDTYFNSKATSDYFRDVKRLHQSKSGVIFYNTLKGLRLFKVSESGKLIIDTTVTNFNNNNILRRVVTGKDGKHWVLSIDTAIQLKQLIIEERNGKVRIEEKFTGLNRPLLTEGYIDNFIEYPKNTFWLVSNRLQMLKVSLDDNYNVVDEKLINLVPDNSSQIIRNSENVLMDVDKNGRVWVAGERLLLNYDTESGEILNLSDNKNYQINRMQILNILVDRSNLLWIGTFYNGLYKIDLENRTFLNSNDFVDISNKYNEGFHHYPIAAMAEDKNGDIWLGALENAGLAKLNGNQLKQSLENPSNHSWDLEYFNNNNAVKNPKFNNIRRIFIDSNDKIWIGSTNGLELVTNSSPNNFQIKRVDDKNNFISKTIISAVFSIEEDFKGDMWIGYWGEGLSKLKENKENGTYSFQQFKFNPNDEFSISNNFVRDILEDSNKNIWVGTVGGLNRIRRRDDGDIKFERFFKDKQDKNSLSNNHVLDVFQSKNGKIYVATFGGGLNEIEVLENNKLKFKHYTIEQGLPSNVVYQISEDNNGNIWMMHIREVSKLNTKTGKVTYFDRQDGFEISEFKDSGMLKTSSGIFLCGGVNGFTFFNPEKLSSNMSEPQVTITDFKLFDETIKPGMKVKNTVVLDRDINDMDKITLPYDLNSIEFGFSSLHFSNPDKNQYKYILEGFEENWQFSKGNDHRFATYTNLPPGNYVFKVSGSNSSGVWGKTTKDIHITIKSPWYATPLAIICFVLFGALVFYIFARIRLNQINLKNQLKLEGAIHEKSLEMNQMKLQFFTNISHELRTPLTLILGPLQQIMHGNVQKEEIPKLNSIMYKNSNRLLKLINQLLDFRKAESGNLELVIQNGELVSFVDGVFNAFEEVASKKNIKFVYLVDETTIPAWFDTDKLEKILYNLLSNAFKFTPQDKTIMLILKTEIVDGTTMAKIDVVDYGIGIPEEDLQSIFDRFYQAKKEQVDLAGGSGLGLAYVKHLVEIHKGTIAIESELHKGTTCTVKIPIQKNAYNPELIASIQPNIHAFKYTKVGVDTIKDSIVPAEGNERSDIKHSDDVSLLLIVEDNIELCEYLTGYFSHFYRVISANNGKEGLELANEAMPDIIISDLMMPVMDGIEMCREIKTNLATSHISVMILTAKAGLENEREGLETGADEFVLKPFNIEVLKLRVDNILRTKKLWMERFKTEKNQTSWKELQNKLDQEFLEKAIHIVNKNIDNVEYSVEQFKLDIGMSRSALFKKLKSVTGQSTSEFIRVIRMKKAVELLESGEYSITEVIFLVGFSDPKYFRTCFKKHFGKTPSEYMNVFKQT